MLQDHWALLHEANGRTLQAIEHRLREIDRIEQLFSMGGPVGPMDRDFLIKTLRKLYYDYLIINEHDEAIQIAQRINSLMR